MKKMIIKLSGSACRLFVVAGLMLSGFGVKAASGGLERDLNKWDLSSNGDPLIQAVLDKKVEEVKLLSKSGAALKITKNKGQLNALHVAVLNGNVPATKTLLENPVFRKNVDQVAPNMQGGADGVVTALCLAVGSNNNAELVQLLISAGADIDRRCGDYEMTPLQLAMFWGQSDAIAPLVNAGANIYALASTRNAKYSLFAVAWRNDYVDAQFALLDALVAYGTKNNISNLSSSIASELIEERVKRDKYLQEIVVDGKVVIQREEIITDAAWDICGPSHTFGDSIAESRDFAISRTRGISRLNRYGLVRLSKESRQSVIDKWWVSRPREINSSAKKYVTPNNFMY